MADTERLYLGYHFVISRKLSLLGINSVNGFIELSLKSSVYLMGKLDSFHSRGKL